MSKLRISHYIESTKVLGPYNRSALWVRGCCFDCEGCLAKGMNIESSTIEESSDLANRFLDIKTSEGITISGGEPFIQAEPLVDMIYNIREKRDYGVIVYSGFTHEELLNKSIDDNSIKELLSQIDILIDGRYELSKDDGLPYRGSSNQRIILISDRYKKVYKDYYFGSNKRNIEILVKPKNIYMIGVPSKQGLSIWKELKKKAEQK